MNSKIKVGDLIVVARYHDPERIFYDGPFLVWRTSLGVVYIFCNDEEYFTDLSYSVLEQSIAIKHELK